METLKHFPVLESYANSIKTLYTWDKAIAGELSYRIIQYGIYGTPPPKNTNPIVVALFNQIKLAIDKGRAQIINGTKWGRPKKAFKDYENSQKPNPNPTNNPTVTQPKANRNKIENNKIENNSNNTSITILTDSKATPKEYGDSNINECIEIIKGFNGWIINGAEKKQRIYAKNLIAKLQKTELVTTGGYTWQDILKVLAIVKNNPYHSAKLGSPELIYYNLASLLQVCEDEFKGGKVSKVKLKAI